MPGDDQPLPVSAEDVAAAAAAIAGAVVTTEFVNEAGHPPRQALDPVLTRFEERHKT